MFSAVFATAGLMFRKNAKKKILKYCKQAVCAAGLLQVLAFLLFEAGFAVTDLRLMEVAGYCSADLPFFYRISAGWAEAKGSFLLWSTLISTAFLLWVRYSANYKKLEKIALPAGAFICLGFTAILIFAINPFTPFPETVSKGAGLNPLLQNVWNVIHPPLLFTGYSISAIPFIISLSASITNRFDRNTIAHIRKWLLAGLTFLTLGILTGARWSYYELGWGGYWAWDPVENASLLPWLAAISALHCIAGTKINSSFKTWAVFVCPLGFILTLIATFATRSGILESVHTFAESPISAPLVVFIILAVLGWLVSFAFYIRKPSCEFYKPASLSVKWQSDILLWTNVTILFTAAVIMLATFTPPLTEIFSTGTTVQLTRQFYDKFTTVIAILLVILLSLSKTISLYKHKNLAPLLIVSVITACLLGIIPFYVFEANLLITFTFCLSGFAAAVSILQFLFTTDKKIGSLLIHTGLLLLIASAGLTRMQTSETLSLKEDESTKVNGITVTYKNLQSKEQDGITRIGALVNISGSNFKKELFPHKNIYPNKRQTTEVDIHTTVTRDIYLWFENLERDGNAAIGIKIIPFMLWFWVAGLMITTGLVCALIQKR
jgi:cytochrome c-type biogenesis protein CcmF